MNVCGKIQIDSELPISIEKQNMFQGRNWAIQRIRKSDGRRDMPTLSDLGSNIIEQPSWIENPELNTFIDEIYHTLEANSTNTRIILSPKNFATDEILSWQHHLRRF